MVQKEMVNNASAVLFRRMPYYLSPQLDIYEKLRPLAREKNVLEVGFGTGLGTLQYASAAGTVRAIEIDPAAVRFAKRCFPFSGITWEEGDVGSYLGAHSLIVMIEVLEHVSDPATALTNIRNCLKPGGQALITVPNKNRERKTDDPLIENEWDAEEFLTELLGYFDSVMFLDYELREYAEFPDTTATPLIALCS